MGEFTFVFELRFEIFNIGINYFFDVELFHKIIHFINAISFKRLIPFLSTIKMPLK